jgi:hypothetical protein
MISAGINILTDADLKEMKVHQFQRGVARGKFEASGHEQDERDVLLGLLNRAWCIIEREVANGRTGLATLKQQMQDVLETR